MNPTAPIFFVPFPPSLFYSHYYPFSSLSHGICFPSYVYITSLLWVSIMNFTSRPPLHNVRLVLVLVVPVSNILGVWLKKLGGRRLCQTHNYPQCLHIIQDKTDYFTVGVMWPDAISTFT